MLIHALAYLLILLLHVDGYKPLLLRLGHGTVFIFIGILGYTSQDAAIDWVAVSAPALLFFQTYVINAFYDTREDRLNGRILLLEPVHLTINYGFALQTVLWGFQHHPRLGTVLAALFLVTELYHNPHIRLKRYGIAQSLLEGMGAALVFSLGGGATATALIVGAAFGIASNLKDLDDHFGDHHAGVNTLLNALIVRLGRELAVLLYKAAFLAAGATAVSLALLHYQLNGEPIALLGLGAVTLSYAVGLFFGLHGERKFLIANGLILGLIPALSAVL